MRMVCATVLVLAGAGAEHAARGPDVSSPEPVAETVRWLDDYRAAYERAVRAKSRLFIWFEDASRGDAGPSTPELWPELWDDPEIRRRIERFVTVRVTTATTITNQGKSVVLSTHAAFSELRGQAGIAVVDLSDEHGPHFGDVVSIYPIMPGRTIPRHELTVLLDLPPGSLTQRTLIFAVRTHPDSPRSTSGELLSLLANEAERHSTYQATLMSQGHHHWEQRFHRLNDQLPRRLIAKEVCAESWRGETLFAAARSCVHSWRQSPGHWSAVRHAQPVYGYDMKRGRNGVWYATGVFGHSR